MAYNPRVGFIGRSLPPLVRRQSIADLLAARRAAYAQANPEWIDDASDPAAEPINAVADLEFRVMQRFNTGVIQLSAATADAGNLDVLAANYRAFPRWTRRRTMRCGRSIAAAYAVGEHRDYAGATGRLPDAAGHSGRLCGPAQ